MPHASDRIDASSAAPSDASETDVFVWDPLVRVGHWTLVVLFFTAYLTEDDFLTLHTWAGYGVGGYVVLRLVWGVVGPRPARFSDFACGPRAALRYLGQLASFQAPRHLGHSPAGGFMIVLLLAALAATTVSGMALLALEENAGPFAAWFGGVDRGGWVEEVHEFLANLTLALVVVHVAGVLVASLVHGENLVRKMITGRKRPD